MNEYDVVVIGAGAGGFTSAITLAERGKKVAIVSDRIPSSALFSGAGYNYEIEEEKFAKPILFFKKIIESTGFPLSLKEKKTHIITQSGGVIESRIYSSLSAAAELNLLLDRKVFFVEIENLDDFISEFIILRLRKYIKKGTSGWQAKKIKFQMGKTGKPYTTITLAKIFDVRENFANFLNEILSDKDIKTGDVILLPPVLGIKNYKENYTLLKNNLNSHVGEVLSFIPSVHGIRLYDAMMRAIMEKGVVFVNGRCSGFSGDGRVETISVRTDVGSSLEINAEAFIYAPGRFIGGGIISGREVKEPVFGLPLYYNENPLRSHFHSLFSYNYRDPQPALNVRIKVNQRFQPLREDSSLFAENLFASGSIIQKSSFAGITGAVVSGYLCAEAVL
jgi:glycerol-3-phosphate dehydrogenase subunit B